MLNPKEQSPVSKPELGVKRDCPECGARFYDLTKEPAHCPKCEHKFVPEALLKPRKQRIPDEPVAKEKPTKPAEETSLEEAEKQKKMPESNRKAGLDEDDDDDDDEEDDELSAIADLEVDVDDDDDDDKETDNSLLDADEDDGDVTSIVPKKGGDGT